MAIEILYCQSYMQTNGQMTVDILLKNPETASIVVGMDMYNTDIPPKVIGPRMVACVPKNTPCFSIRYTNIPFTDPYNIHVKRCISGPNCATNGCTTFGTLVDDAFMGDMVDFGSPGVSGVPREIFGPNAKYSTGMPPNIQATCAPPPPPVAGLNITGVTAELSVSDVFPGSQGWTRINVTATGSGMISVLVDGTELVSESLNPGATPFTFTYLKQLTAGTKNICVQAVGGNKVCTSITVPGVVIRKDSCLTINTRNTPPFRKGENVAIYGILEECGPILNPDINDAYISIKIKIDSTEVKSYGTKTYVSTSIGENWSYVWQVPSTYGASLDTAGKNITVEAYYYGDSIHGPIAKTSVIGAIEVVAPPPTGFTVSADKTAIASGDYVVFTGTYKPGMKVGIYSNKGYIATTVTNAAGGYKVGEAVTVPPSTDTTAVKLTIFACAEGAISGICPLLAEKSNNINIDVTPKAIVPPPPVAEATHAFVINLSPLSWADLDGLKAYLPNITTEFTKAITLYGWLGWEVVESRIEDGNKLVIYLRETAAASGMGLSEVASKVRAMALPTLVAIVAAVTAISAIALKFGFMILGFYIVNLLTKAVEVAKTQADTEKIRTDVVAGMCKSGQLTPEQCVEAIKPPAEKGICETFGFSAVACDQVKTGVLIVGGTIGAYLLYKAVKKVTPSA